MSKKRNHQALNYSAAGGVVVQEDQVLVEEEEVDLEELTDTSSDLFNTAIVVAGLTIGPLLLADERWIAGAVATFGKHVSRDQRLLLRHHFTGRPLVILPDADARQDQAHARAVTAPHRILELRVRPEIALKLVEDALLVFGQRHPGLLYLTTKDSPF